jgi:hypothetical protein
MAQAINQTVLNVVTSERELKASSSTLSGGVQIERKPFSRPARIDIDTARDWTLRDSKVSYRTNARVVRFLDDFCWNRLVVTRCESLQPQETKLNETESRLAFLTESISTLQEIEPSKTVKVLAGPMHGWHVFLMIFVGVGGWLWHWCASLQPQETKPHETESRLAFFTESISTLQEIEPSKTVKVLAGPTHGLSYIHGFFFARAIAGHQNKVTTDQIKDELKETYTNWLAKGKIGCLHFSVLDCRAIFHQAMQLLWLLLIKGIILYKKNDSE